MFDFLGDWFEGLVDTVTGTPGVDEATGGMVDNYLDGTTSAGETVSGAASGVGSQGMPGVNPSMTSFVDSLNQDMAEASHIASGEATLEEMEASVEQSQYMSGLYGGAAASQEISNSVVEHEATTETLNQAHEARIDAAQTEIQADSAISAAGENLDDTV